jgi:hypothetical protein
MRKEFVSEKCKSANTWAVFVERHVVFNDAIRALQNKYDHLHFFKTEEQASKFCSQHSANNKFIVSNTGEFKEAA